MLLAAVVSFAPPEKGHLPPHPPGLLRLGFVVLPMGQRLFRCHRHPKQILPSHSWSWSSNWRWPPRRRWPIELILHPMVRCPSAGRQSKSSAGTAIPDGHFGQCFPQFCCRAVVANLLSSTAQQAVPIPFALALCVMLNTNPIQASAPFILPSNANRLLASGWERLAARRTGKCGPKNCCHIFTNLSA